MVWLRSVPRFLLPHIQTHCSSQGVWGMTHQVWANPKPSNMPGNHRGRTIPGGWRRPGRLCLHATWPNLWLKKSLRIHETTFLFGNGINVYSLQNLHSSPEKWCLEDFPFEMGSFCWGHVSFQGCLFTFSFILSLTVFAVFLGSARG